MMYNEHCITWLILNETLTNSLTLLCCQEGPHSALNEDEFYDAMEIALDRQDELDKEVTKFSLCYSN